MSVAFATATIAVLAPWALMMPPGIAYGTAVALAMLGLLRGYQAWRVIRYQRNMRKLPTYQLRANQIPLSQRKLFLGKGFRWTQKHTQRLRDTLRPLPEIGSTRSDSPFRWANRAASVQARPRRDLRSSGIDDLELVILLTDESDSLVYKP